MKTLLISLLLATNFLVAACTGGKVVGAREYPGGFVDVQDFIPSVQLDIRYYGTQNFVGARIDGYDAPKCLLTKEAAMALLKVQTQLAQNGQSLKIFDCYRPQRAVDHFVRWAKDLNDVTMKSTYYPSVDKKNLFRDGYIAEKSGHSRGSTVDLTIIDSNSNRELDMGTNFDYFDPRSHTANPGISDSQRDNRNALKSLMERNGYKNLEEEWWHYTLKRESYPNQYFDFKVD